MPLGVSISLPSLRVNHQLRTLPKLMTGIRKAGLTLAPGGGPRRHARADPQEDQERRSLRRLPGGVQERLAARQALFPVRPAGRTRRSISTASSTWPRRFRASARKCRAAIVEVTASVSNFVPKPHTPYQWNGMQTREYLQWAGQYLRKQCRLNARVKIKQHDIECSLLEGVLTRGDRRIAVALEEAWRRGCRLDGWSECFQPDVWWQTFADLGIDTTLYSQRDRPMTEVLPWDHINVKKPGASILEKEQNRSVLQLQVMAEAT